jgi:ATP-dependent Zn protease
MSDIEPRPDPGADPTEPIGLPGVRGSGHRQRKPDTRKPLSWWDRIKFLLLFGILFLLVLWGKKVQYTAPGVQISWGDALHATLQSAWWLLALAAIEAIRQIHYVISESSPAYHRAWTGFYERIEKRSNKMNAWNRYRLARATKFLFWLVVLDLVLASALDVSPVTALFELPTRLVGAAPFIFQLLFAFVFVMFQFVGLFWFLSRGGVDVYFPDDIDTRFSDVKGQDRVLERVQENVIFLQDPESIEDRGGYVPGGILLWGPPGTGKTLMARAVAGETSRPFVFVEPGAFINMFMGVGILKVKGLYRKLRKFALKYGGVIVFFDEADALGSRGALQGGGPGWNFQPDAAWETKPACNGMAYLSPDTQQWLAQESLFPGGRPTGAPDADPGRKGIIAGLGGMGGGGMGTLQSLLSEMDGLKKPRGFFNRRIRRLLGMRPKPPPKYRILHMFATNMPQALDEAMLRPGRIDRIYKVGLPAKEGRKETYRYYLGRVRHTLTDDQVEKLAIITPYATGASIQDMVNEALVIAVRDGRESIQWADIIRAKQLKEHGLPDDFEYIERERHAVAVHEACHAVAMYQLRFHQVIDIATIERRGDTGGFVSFIPPEDVFTHWKSEYEIDVMCSLASLAGERMFFDMDNSAGVGGDLAHATAVTTRMMAYHGMGTTIGSHRVTKAAFSGRSMGTAEDGTDRNLLETELGSRVEARLRELYDETWTVLEQHRRHVLVVAHALETHKTMSGDDVAALIEGTKGPLIDGRPYADPAFVDELERYHEEAVEAHRSHAKVAVPLPVVTAPFQLELPGSNGDGAAGNGHVAPVPAPEGAAEPPAPNGQGTGGHVPEAPPRPDVD